MNVRERRKAIKPKVTMTKMAIHAGVSIGTLSAYETNPHLNITKNKERAILASLAHFEAKNQK